MRLFVNLMFLSLFFAVQAKGEGEVNDTTRLKIPRPQLHKTAPVILADSIPGIFVQVLDEMYAKWYVDKSVTTNFPNFDESAETIAFSGIPDSVFLERLDAIQSPIKLSYNEIVRNYIELYTVKRRAQVATMLGLSEYYFPLFEEILDREGLPHELKYLPVIESALNPRAFSRAGACGLWQFMHATGKIYQLEINSFVDERRDPLRSTEAAVAFLKDLYSIYNDWMLVIAAYNCGPGNVNKAIRRTGEKRNYWDIYYQLPKETRGYVPAFIAAMYVFTYHKEHQIYPVSNELPTMCDSIMISKALHFDQIVNLLDISSEQLRDLNPQYRGDVIPAGFGKTYALRLPYNYVGDFIERQDTIFAHNRNYYFDDSDRTANPKERIKHFAHVAPNNKAKLIYTVKSGDVLGEIAGRFKVKLADLKYWNNKSNNMIRVGEKLTVYVANDKVSHYQKLANTKYAGKASNAETVTEPLIEGEYTIYTIRQGENLWTIAKKFPGVSNEDIMRWNGISQKGVKNLKPGQKLKIKI